MKDPVLLNGDCVDLMRRLPPDHFNTVITSPPYNIGKEYGEYSDDMERKKFKNWCDAWIGCVRAVLHPSGSFFLNVGSSPSNPMLPFELVEICSRQGLKLQNVFHWIKSITVPDKRTVFCGEISLAGEISIGHFKPINSKRFVNDCHEYVFHFTFAGTVELDRLAIGVPYADKSNLKRWKHTAGRDLRCRGNVWFIPYDTIQKSRAHPAEFPVQLALNCIRLHKGARRVLDPFLGGGNSGIAAQRVGVEFCGIELDRLYFDIAAKRIQAEKNLKKSV